MASVKIKPVSMIPYDQSVSPDTIDALNTALVSLNQLIGQANVPIGQGINSLSVNTVNPTTGQIISSGIRTGSITTPLVYVVADTYITWYWDGSVNASVQSFPFVVYRDDGTATTPYKTGSPLKITGLTPSPSSGPATTYYYYPYWDEGLQQIKFVTNNGGTIKNAVGTPAYAFPQANIYAAQQQILRGHIPLALSANSTGINMLQTAGTPTGGSGGSGGGAGGGSGGGGQHFVA